MDLLLDLLNGANDVFTKTLSKKITMTLNSNAKHCKWEPFGDKFKCSECGFVSPRSTIKRNCSTKPEPPSMVKRAVNFTKAVTQHVMTGRKHCSEEQKAERFNICKSNQCGLFLPNGEGGICSHDKCGCYIRSNGQFMDKLSWAESKCPVDMWGPIIQKDEENTQNGV